MTDASIDAKSSAAGCPFHVARTIPTDGTPLRPSPQLTGWREEASATPLQYPDGHDGWIVTGYELARAVLEDPRFSQQPQRMPGQTHGDAQITDVELDGQALAALEVANLLSLDAPQHARIRRSLLARFSVRAVRGYQAGVAAIVAQRLEQFKAHGSPANLTQHFAQPISAAVHCRILGVPEEYASEFSAVFVEKSTMQQKFDYLREVLSTKRQNPGDDVLSDLIRSELTASEVEGLTFVLFVSGRDSVAYMIATATVALLSNPDQLAALRIDPELMAGAVEEFMRYGTMFVTLFPRTATEQIDFGEVHFASGESVSVSSVAANRDERRFPNPDAFDITRDAYGHLGFGHGIHGCVGQQLARVEIREAISQMLVGLPDLYLVEAEQTRPMPFSHPVATYEAGAVIVAWE